MLFMHQLTATKRDIFGKKTTLLREKGFLPAVLYGGGGDSQALTVEKTEFLKAWKNAGESSVLNLAIDGDGMKSVLIHDVMIDPVKSNPLHVDFYEVAQNRLLKLHVPLVFVGESDVVKSLGGVLVKVLHEVEVEALPRDLPHEIKVDISLIKSFADHILLKDLVIPAGVVLHGDKDTMIVKVDEPRTTEEIESLEKPAEIDLEKIEVEKKGKTDGEITEEVSEEK